jgi:hypothetical protein
MLKNLAMLLKLRAWLRSGGLQAGGAVAVLGAVQTWLSSNDGTDLMATAAMFLHLMPATLGGIITGLLGLAMLGLRVKAEWSLTEVVAGTDKAPPP